MSPALFRRRKSGNPSDASAIAVYQAAEQAPPPPPRAASPTRPTSSSAATIAAEPPRSYAQLADLADEIVASSWDPKLPLRLWLESVEKLSAECDSCRRQGDQDTAFVRAATVLIILTRVLPRHHPEWDTMSAGQRAAIQGRLSIIERAHTELKAVLIGRTAAFYASRSRPGLEAPTTRAQGHSPALTLRNTITTAVTVYRDGPGPSYDPPPIIGTHPRRSLVGQSHALIESGPPRSNRLRAAFSRAQSGPGSAAGLLSSHKPLSLPDADSAASPVTPAGVVSQAADLVPRSHGRRIPKLGDAVAPSRAGMNLPASHRMAPRIIIAAAAFVPSAPMPLPGEDDQDSEAETGPHLAVQADKPQAPIWMNDGRRTEGWVTNGWSWSGPSQVGPPQGLNSTGQTFDGRAGVTPVSAYGFAPPVGGMTPPVAVWPQPIAHCPGQSVYSGLLVADSPAPVSYAGAATYGHTAGPPYRWPTPPVPPVPPPHLVAQPSIPVPPGKAPYVSSTAGNTLPVNPALATQNSLVHTPAPSAPSPTPSPPNPGLGPQHGWGTGNDMQPPILRLSPGPIAEAGTGPGRDHRGDAAEDQVLPVAPTASDDALCPLILPAQLVSHFMNVVAADNNQRNIETCGFLLGHVKDKVYTVSHLLVPKQEGTPNTCTATKEEETFAFQEASGLITLGWIHTHPTQSIFLSSLDLHTHLGFQRQLREAVAVVCAPSAAEDEPQYGVFRMTDPPGMEAVAACRETGAFHPHPPLPLYTDVDEEGGHCRVLDDAPFECIDLR